MALITPSILRGTALSRHVFGPAVASLLAIGCWPDPARSQAGNGPPVFPSVADPFVFEGTIATVVASATDPDGDPITYSETGPAWFVVHPTSGVATLKPDFAAAQVGGGVYPVNVEASDGQNVAAIQFTIHVLDTPTTANWCVDFDTFESKRDVYTLAGGLGELVYDPPPDLELGGPMPLVFDRYYASIAAWEPYEPSGVPASQWFTTYSWRFSVTGSEAIVIDARGRVYRFQAVGPGVWALTRPLHAPYQLVQQAGGFTFADPIAQMRYGFDAATLQLVSIIDRNGNRHLLAYRGGLVSQVSDEFGRSLSFAYDAQDRVASASDGVRTVYYDYDPATGELTTYTDALGQETQYGYAPGPVAGLLASVTLPAGNTPFTATYDAQQGRLMLDSDASGGGWAFGAVTIPSPLGIEATATKGGAGAYLHEWGHYDPSLPFLLLSNKRDPLGNATTFDYDAVGRITAHARPEGDTRQVTYHAASGLPASLLLPDGTTTTYDYDPRSVGPILFHDLVSADYADGTAGQWDYDAAGNVTQHTEATGAVWTYSYNSSGQLAVVDPPDIGTNLTVGYDAAGRANSVTSLAGGMTTYEYDALDRLVRMTHPDLTHRDYGYDALNRLTSLTDERGKVWVFQYNPNGGLALRRDPLLHENHFAYDALDRVTSWTDPVGEASTFGYDLGGRLASRTDRTMRTTSFSYDALDRMIQRVLPGGSTTTFTYDDNGRLLTETGPSGTAQYEYDGLDRITRFTDRLNHSTDCVYDAGAREMRVIPPVGDPIAYTYTPRLQLQELMIGSPGSPSVTTSWTYTAWGAPLVRTDPNGQPWTLAYDLSGRVAGFTDPLSRTTTYGYDSRDRLVQATMPVGSVSFDYDATSHLTSRTFGSGSTLTYTYDDAGRLTAGTGFSRSLDALGRVASSDGVTYAYDAEGRLTGLTFGPSKSVTYGYDGRGLLASVQDWVGGVTQISRDAAGRRSELARPNGTTAAYEYDAMDRLTRIVDGGASPILDLTLERDARGSITSAVRVPPPLPGMSAASETLSYDAASQVVGYTYDGNGRRLQGGGRTYQWDPGSRLVQLTQPAGTVTYAYDALDRMVARNDGTARGYVWSEATDSPAIHVERQGASDLRYLVRTPMGELLHTVEAPSNARFFAHPDERGGVVAETAGDGSINGMYRYDPKGRDTAQGSTGRYLYYPFRFGGGAVHEGPDLYRFGSGIYDAVTASGLTPKGGAGPPGAEFLLDSGDFSPRMPTIGSVYSPDESWTGENIGGNYGGGSHGSLSPGGGLSGAPRIFIALPTSDPSVEDQQSRLRPSLSARVSHLFGAVMPVPDARLVEGTVAFFGDTDAPLGTSPPHVVPFAPLGAVVDVPDPRIVEGTVALFGNTDTPLGSHPPHKVAPFVHPVPLRAGDGLMKIRRLGAPSNERE